MKVVSKYQALKQEQWAEGCQSWNLLDEPGLSVKQEHMAPGRAEHYHLHRYAQQFFFILSGVAVFEIEGERIQVGTHQGIHIQRGKPHRIINESDEDLEFLLASEPSAVNDRINQAKI
jgi:mannose-6-phosphate isomerase-like protein (cupin superfamily)